MQAALSKTVDARTRDSVALAVSQANGCSYCLCAHSHVAATFNKTPDGEIVLAREESPLTPNGTPQRHSPAS
jgi:AhpD family alkylhydroperoxidase